MPRACAEPESLQTEMWLLPPGRTNTTRYDFWREPRALPIGAALCDKLIFGGSQPALAATGAPQNSVEGSWRQFVCKQHQLYGTRLLLFLSIVNLLYGVATSWFIYINNYYLGVDLKLSPSQTQSAVATMGICIIVRPILGAVSDAVPILGSRRRAYFLLAGVGSSCCFLALAAFKPGVQISPWSATALLCVANVLGYAWCGVILYAIVAEEQRRDPVDGAVNLNALQWGCYSSGALLGDLSEGFLLKMMSSPHQCYWMMCLLWSAMAACSLLYKDGLSDDELMPAQQEDTSLPDHTAIEMANNPKEILDASVESAPALHVHVAVDTPNGGQLAIASAETHAAQEHGLAMQIQRLWVAVDPQGPTQGVILSAVLYIFLTWALVPDVSSVTYFFYTGSSASGGLGFGEVTYSMLSVVGDIAMLLASYIYGAYLGSTPLRKLFIGLQLLNVAASALDLVLALRWNEAIGVNAKIFAGLDQAIFYCAWQLKNLPVYTLAAKLCPPGVEATLTATIAGLNDLSGALAQYFGAWLTRACQVSGTRLHGAWLVYVVRTLCKLLPIPLVVLVPTEERLDSALRRLDQRLSAPKLQPRRSEMPVSTRPGTDVLAADTCNIETRSDNTVRVVQEQQSM